MIISPNDVSAILAPEDEAILEELDVERYNMVQVATARPVTV